MIMRLVLFFFAACALFAQKYSGPVPEKTDLLYLVQADNLIPTEAAVAKEQKGKKGESAYIVAGAASTARTPLASPAFVVKTKQLEADKLELYKLDVKSGHREITLRKGRGARNPEPVRIDIKRFDDDIYRLEVSESLPNGQYSFTPVGSNDVFCFEVF
jgi:hypothetical protein